jgi:queuine/archaeosine tRNA-ribosyltransferase
MLSTPPYSQKRITKSIERSCSWLLDLLSPHSSAPRIVFVHLAGGSSAPARHAFSTTLQENMYGKEAEAVQPLSTLDEGLSGYVFDLAPIRLQVAAESVGSQPSVTKVTPCETSPTDRVQSIEASHTPMSTLQRLCKASLTPLSEHKIRLANSVASPHEILRLIQDVGIDLFDSHWAQKAADIGVGLDFCFPVVHKNDTSRDHPRIKQDIGHNLYNNLYTHDFNTISNSDCCCLSCQPSPPAGYIPHSGVDTPTFGAPNTPEGFTRSYIHHLLHTHEMSAHTLLVMHNLTVLDEFFAGVRRTVLQGEKAFGAAVEEFCTHYDENLAVFEEARIMWDMVDKARGKGRLGREKERQGGIALQATVSRD